MAVIQKEIELEGTKGRKKVIALFDRGATYSYITPKLAQELELILPLPAPLEFETAKDGEKVIARGRVTLNFYIEGCRFSD
jgi:hypothetical protein